MWLHYEADPSRDAAWAAAERKNYLYESDWEREQNMEFNAGGGELVLAAVLRARQDKILITEPGYAANPMSNFYAGMDWGERNPTSFHVYEVTRTGTIRSIMEHYLANSHPGAHGEIIKGMRIKMADGTAPEVLRVIKRIYADPSIFWDMQSQESGGFKGLAELFPKEMFMKMVPGQRGQDNTCKDRVLGMWKSEVPGYQLVCEGGIPEVKREGTFDSCPNQVWEMMRLRRAELGEAQLKSKNPTEKLVQKHNHSWDDFCYFLTGGPVAPKETKDDKWQQRKMELMRRNPSLDVNSLIHYRARFEADYAKQEKLPSWR